MSLTFADTPNMVAYLKKSDASEGFNQVIDFLNGIYIKYDLTINPHIYASCIKQLWNTVVVKQTNDITRLQALVDKKKVMIMEATIRDALRLNDAEGVDCLPNEEIFAKLARMGYEKSSTKLTFYNSAMESAVICLSNGRNFNFSKYIFDSLGNDNDVAQGADTAVSGDDVQDQSIPSPTLPTSPPQPPQDIPSTSQGAEKKAKDAQVAGDEQVKGRRRKGVVIKDPEEESESTAKTPTETKSKDNGKG
nr:hypothetical protein [Tanacetum cinerariifolium]